MRPFFLGLAVLAAVSYLSYRFGSDPLSSSSAPKRATPASLPVAPRMAQIRVGEDAGKNAVSIRHRSEKKQSPQHRSGQTLPRPDKAGPSATPVSRQREIETVESAEPSERDQLAALGIRPRPEGDEVKAEKGRVLSRRMGKNRVLAKRWDKSVSGPHARPAIFSKKADQSCSATITKLCERRQAKDATITGVVVTTEKLAEDPSQPFEGRIKAGHYAEATPALYVK